VTDFPRDLVPAVGMCVEYDIVDDRGRPKAVNVRAPS
jgi:cold shock CspA family protein